MTRPSRDDAEPTESTQPAERSRQVWWAECTMCGANSYGTTVPAFDSPAEMWSVLEGLDYGWTRRDDGRVLCRIHSCVADCDRDGHHITQWLGHPIESTLQWRYCQHCGGVFEQRIHPSGWAGVNT